MPHSTIEERREYMREKRAKVTPITGRVALVDGRKRSHKQSEGGP